MLAGTSPGQLQPDDIRLATDLGLVRQSTMGGLEVTSPIYREIFVRELAERTTAAPRTTPGARSVTLIRA